MQVELLITFTRMALSPTTKVHSSLLKESMDLKCILLTPNSTLFLHLQEISEFMETALSLMLTANSSLLKE